MRTLFALLVVGSLMSSGCSIVGANKYARKLETRAKYARATAPVFATPRTLNDYFDANVTEPSVRSAISVSSYNGHNIIEIEVSRLDGYIAMWKENPGEALWRTLVDAGIGFGGYKLAEKVFGGDDKSTNTTYNQEQHNHGSGAATQQAGNGNTSTSPTTTTTTTTTHAPPAVEPTPEPVVAE